MCAQRPNCCFTLFADDPEQSLTKASHPPRPSGTSASSCQALCVLFHSHCERSNSAHRNTYTAKAYATAISSPKICCSTPKATLRSPTLGCQPCTSSRRPAAHGPSLNVVAAFHMLRPSLRRRRRTMRSRLISGVVESSCLPCLLEVSALILRVFHMYSAVLSRYTVGRTDCQESRVRSISQWDNIP